MVDRNIRTKRVYAQESPEDGLRVLVDRIWPRGLTKQTASLDDWMKEVAPSTQLRKWFGHRPERWNEFRRRYRKELVTNSAVRDIRSFSKNQRITLLYAAHDTEHNHASVLAEYLRRTARAPKRQRPTRQRTRVSG